MIWNETMETMARPKIEMLQSERLRQLVARVYERVPFYKQTLDAAGIRPNAIKSIADLPRLPFTKKTDLRDHYPFGLFAVPMHEVLRLHASSGTTGKPTVVGYTRDDLRIWAEVCARCLALSGAQPGQMFQNAYGYGLFTGGLGMHYGAEQMGLTVIPVSGGNTARQIMLIRDFGPHILACTPSYALTLADALLDQRIALDSLNLQTLVLGAEPWTEAMRQEIEAQLPVNAVNIYGLSEIIGPGVSNECVEAKDGSHIFEDHFIVEVINPDTGELLPDGTVGELVFTTLTKQALPLIRYRTGDMASVRREPCRCGRTQARMSRVVGRVDDMLIIRGINVFPSQIEATLVGIEHVTPHYQIIVTREKRLDVLTVQVEVTEPFFRSIGADRFQQYPASRVEELHHLEAVIHKKLHDALGLQVKVTLLPPQTAPRSEGGKLQRVLDKRTLRV
jgi:phenylacetate-CoA ligase